MTLTFEVTQVTANGEEILVGEIEFGTDRDGDWNAAEALSRFLSRGDVDGCALKILPGDAIRVASRSRDFDEYDFDADDEDQ